MHICTVATLCFPDKTIPRNYYYCVQDDNSLCLCFKSMYRILFVAIFTSAFIFSMFKSSHTYRNINISNQQSYFFIEKPPKNCFRAAQSHLGLPPKRVQGLVFKLFDVRLFTARVGMFRYRQNVAINDINNQIGFINIHCCF